LPEQSTLRCVAVLASLFARQERDSFREQNTKAQKGASTGAATGAALCGACHSAGRQWSPICRARSGPLLQGRRWNGAGGLTSAQIGMGIIPECVDEREGPRSDGMWRCRSTVKTELNAIGPKFSSTGEPRSIFYAGEFGPLGAVPRAGCGKQVRSLPLSLLSFPRQKRLAGAVLYRQGDSGRC
jgi:hypothetical protein